MVAPQNDKTHIIVELERSLRVVLIHTILQEMIPGNITSQPLLCSSANQGRRQGRIATV